MILQRRCEPQGAPKGLMGPRGRQSRAILCLNPQENRTTAGNTQESSNLGRKKKREKRVRKG